MKNIKLTVGPRRAWTLAHILHLPAGKTYRDFLSNDVAYCMIDVQKNTAANGGIVTVNDAMINEILGGE